MIVAETYHAAAVRHRQFVRTVLWALAWSLGMIVPVIGMSNVAEESAAFFGFLALLLLVILVAIGFVVLMIVRAWQLLEAMGESRRTQTIVVLLFFALATFVPFGEWALIGVLHHRARRFIAQGGIEVGLLGATEMELEQLRIGFPD